MADRFPSPTSPSGGEQSILHVDPRFTDLKPLGFGGNGLVFSALDGDCDKAVAIKKLSFYDKKSCKYALREIKIMRRLQHENIVTVYEVLGPNGYALGTNTSININEMTSIYLVQELLDADLMHLISNPALTQEHIRLFLYQLIRGLKYIHSANVVHRDLKPSNLLINVEDLVLKIGDFGLARVVDMEYLHKGFLTDGIGTCWYRSPELIISPRDYTKAIDMWSVGCIFAEMLTGKPLFNGGNEMDQIGQMLDVMHLNDNEWNKLTQILPNSVLRKRSKVPKISLKSKFKEYGSDALDLLERLLVFNPVKRLSAEEALSHPYLERYSCPEDEPIVLKALRIEHEVDELSPKTLRRMINEEMVESIETCGNQVEITMEKSNPLPNDADEVEIKNIENSSQSGSTECLSSQSGSIECVDSTENDKNSKLRKTLALIENTDGSQEEQCLHIMSLKELQIVVDLPDEENRKEQSSPKEEKSKEIETFSEKEADTSIEDKPENVLSLSKIVSNEIIENKELQNVILESVKDKEECPAAPVIKEKSKLDSKVSTHKPNLTTKRKVTCPKVKDRLNEEKRAESPREMVEKWDKNRSRNNETVTTKSKTREKSKREIHKEEKMMKNNHSKIRDESDRSQDFDSMYRLPTEHLSHQRVRRRENSSATVKNVEVQLRLHEKLNAKLRLAEFEKDKCIGAMGGYTPPHIPMDTHEEGAQVGKDELEPRSRSSSGSSGTTDCGNINDLIPRRFEH